MDKTQADLDLYFLTRNVQWRYRLDQYEDAAIAEMLKTVRSTVAEIKQEIFDGDVPENADELVAELEALSAGLRKRIGEDVATMSSVAGEYSVAEHTAIMSLDGAAKINTVALSAAQFKEFLGGGPTQGTPLPAWVDAAWGEAVSQKIKRNLNVAVLRGEGYRKAVRGLLDAGLADFTEREAITIARTYVQTANVAAQMAVYQANDDLVTGWKWSSVLEPGYSKSGRGTCMRCAALDGQVFQMGKGPSIPLHPRCRCVAIPVTKTWRELGIDRDEIEAAIRPYTIRPDANIDAGGMRTIIESGRHQGNYASWFAKQPKDFKINAVGPNRYKLLESGGIKFDDLIDREGNLRTLKQLRLIT
jgi:hypothetical protein